MPARYTGDGEDLSLPLRWTPGPEGTRAYALFMEDPDVPVGTWIHWVAWNIPDLELSEGIPPRPVLSGGMRQGKNSWHRRGYGGPIPPRGAHHYIIRVFALDRPLDLSPEARKPDLVRAMEGCMLARGELMVRYTRAISRWIREGYKLAYT
jgi:Raf kinase inhibitor-like YbhB/YbcL family protein